MANVNLPAPVIVAGGGLCLLAGFLVGVVAGPDTPESTTAVVDSFDVGSGELCLTGDSIADREGAKDGVLCGRWQRTPGAAVPQSGDDFAFVSVTTAQAPAGSGVDAEDRILIYGDVVD